MIKPKQPRPPTLPADHHRLNPKHRKGDGTFKPPPSSDITNGPTGDAMGTVDDISRGPANDCEETDQ